MTSFTKDRPLWTDLFIDALDGDSRHYANDLPGEPFCFAKSLPQEIGACEMRVLRGDGCYLRGRDTDTLASQQVGSVTASCEKIAYLPKFISGAFPRGSAVAHQVIKRPSEAPHCFPSKVLLTWTLPTLPDWAASFLSSLIFL